MIFPIETTNCVEKNKLIQIISKEYIEFILSYVKKSEQRIIDCTIIGKTICATVKCKSPEYTLKPVKYYSSSELMISLAQITHILIDHYVNSEGFYYNLILTPKMLSELREQHKLYFVEMNYKFSKKIEADIISIEITLESLKHLNGNFIAKFNFKSTNALSGGFLAFLVV